MVFDCRNMTDACFPMACWHPRAHRWIWWFEVVKKGQGSLAYHGAFAVFGCEAVLVIERVLIGVLQEDPTEISWENRRLERRLVSLACKQGIGLAILF